MLFAVSSVARAALTCVGSVIGDQRNRGHVIGDRPRFLLKGKGSGLAFCAWCTAGIMKFARPNPSLLDPIPSVLATLFEGPCETKSIYRNVNPEFLF